MPDTPCGTRGRRNHFGLMRRNWRLSSLTGPVLTSLRCQTARPPIVRRERARKAERPTPNLSANQTEDGRIPALFAAKLPAHSCGACAYRLGELNRSASGLFLSLAQLM